jgi:magnesium transporter
MKNNTKKTHLLRKKGDPYKYVYTGLNSADKLDAQFYKYNSNTVVESTVLQLADFYLPQDSNYSYWWNIHGLANVDDLTKIAETFQIHSLAIQDILDVNQRPKFQEYEQYSFLTIKSILFVDKDLDNEQISFIFTSNYLLSFQEKKADYFDHLRTRLKENKGIVRERGGDFLLYVLLESILDNYFLTLEDIENKIDKFNELIFAGNPSPKILEDIEQYKNMVLKLKKVILPLKEFSKDVERGNVKHVEKRHIKYFQEIEDLCLTLFDHCEILQHKLESKSNLYFSVQGHRLNQVMIILTIVATIFIPLTFIAGIYGMNFQKMPELSWTYGYLMVWVVFLLVGALMVYNFKKRKWL